MGQGIKKISENVISPGRSLTIVNNSIHDNTNFEIGTLKCYPSDSGLRYKSDLNTFNLFDAVNILQEYSIEEILMANNSVSTRTIRDQNVTTDKIKDLNVTNIKIENKGPTSGIVASEKVRDGSIVTATLGEGCVINTKIHDKTINADEKIMNQTITTPLLRGGTDINGVEIPGCVTTPKIANENVTTSKLADKCVINQKIADNTIENIKLYDFTIQGGNQQGTGKIAEKTITAFNVADRSLTDSNFAYGSVTGYSVGGILKTQSIIADNTITDTNIATNTITNARLLTRTIKGAAAGEDGKIAYQTITGDNIKDSSIGINKFETNVFNVIKNAVVYERDTNNNLCVKLRGAQLEDGNEETCYMNISGHLDVEGDITGARVYNMAYSDLAEGYVPGEELEAGDIVAIHEDGKVYKATQEYIAAIVGVVSDEYAACYGASVDELRNKEKVAVALIGKVHVKVKGNIMLGQKVKYPIFSDIEDGVGIAASFSNSYTIGKALETVDSDNFDEIHKVLCLVYPN